MDMLKKGGDSIWVVGICGDDFIQSKPMNVLHPQEQIFNSQEVCETSKKNIRPFSGVIVFL